jgi:hypothetical protein
MEDISRWHPPPIRCSPPSSGTARRRKRCRRCTNRPTHFSRSCRAQNMTRSSPGLTTPPTTMAGVIATLEHASRRVNDPDYANLAESAQCLGDALTDGEAYPQMIADAPRKIARRPAGPLVPPNLGIPHASSSGSYPDRTTSRNERPPRLLKKTWPGISSRPTPDQNRSQRP